MEHLTLDAFGSTIDEGIAILQGIHDSKVSNLKELILTSNMKWWYLEGQPLICGPSLDLLATVVRRQKQLELFSLFGNMVRGQLFQNVLQAVFESGSI